MSEFRLRVNTDNAAFDDPGELARILRKVADRVEDETGRERVLSQTVLDVNGNDVGRWKVEA